MGILTGQQASTPLNQSRPGIGNTCISTSPHWEHKHDYYPGAVSVNNTGTMTQDAPLLSVPLLPPATRPTTTTPHQPHAFLPPSASFPASAVYMLYNASSSTPANKSTYWLGAQTLMCVLVETSGKQNSKISDYSTKMGCIWHFFTARQCAIQSAFFIYMLSGANALERRTTIMLTLKHHCATNHHFCPNQKRKQHDKEKGICGFNW